MDQAVPDLKELSVNAERTLHVGDIVLKPRLAKMWPKLLLCHNFGDAPSSAFPNAAAPIGCPNLACESISSHLKIRYNFFHGPICYARFYRVCLCHKLCFEKNAQTFPSNSTATYFPIQRPPFRNRFLPVLSTLHRQNFRFSPSRSITTLT